LEVLVASRTVKTSIELTVEIEIACQVPEVWSCIADFERVPEFYAEFKTVSKQLDGPVGMGTVLNYTLEPGNRSGTIEIVEWDPPRRVAWDGPPLPWAGGAARPRGSHWLTEVDEGRTLLVSRYHPELIGTQVLLRPYLKSWMRRERRTTAQALKASLEGAPR
jgi:uncharacterized protein YndB with AHSA1/START domain